MTRCILLFLLLAPVLGLHAQQLAPAGTPLNDGNYTWDRRTTNAITSSGQRPYYQVVRFNVAVSGNYTMRMNPVGFRGAMTLYQGSFQPTFPEANFWTTGVVGSSSGAQVNFPTFLNAGSTFVLVLTAATTGESGTFSANITGPAGVTVLPPPSALSIVSQPEDRVVRSDQTATFEVHAEGLLPHSWQWFEGLPGDTSLPVVGATGHRYTTPALPLGERTYWVRIQDASGAFTNSGAATIEVSDNPGANFFRGLGPGDLTWNIQYRIQPGSGNLSYYEVIGIRIQQAGTYTFRVDGEGFTPVLNAYANSFNPAQPRSNYLFDAAIGATKTVSLLPGTIDLVISSTTTLGRGTFSGSISGPSVVLLNPPPPLGFTQQPLDQTISQFDRTFFTIGIQGLPPFTIQWYEGERGDTSRPIAGADERTYETPSISRTSAYWVRVSNPTGFIDSRTVIALVQNEPFVFRGTLDGDSPLWNRPTSFNQVASGQYRYAVLPFTVTQDGTYSFRIVGTGFRPLGLLYSAVFQPNSPIANLSGFTVPRSGNLVELTQNLLGGPGVNHLVITNEQLGQGGSFTVEQIAGPALINPLVPIIVEEPTDQAVPVGDPPLPLSVNVIRTDSIQWYWRPIGSSAGFAKIPGATSSTYTPNPGSGSFEAYVEVSNTASGVAGRSQTVRYVWVPVPFPDFGGTDEDRPVFVDVLDNDTTLAGEEPTLVITSQPNHGFLQLIGGVVRYQPSANSNGIDTFRYRLDLFGVSSAEALVTIFVNPVNDPPFIAGILSETILTPTAPSAQPLTGAVFSSGGGLDELFQQVTATVVQVPPQAFAIVRQPDGTAFAPGDPIDPNRLNEITVNLGNSEVYGQMPFTIRLTDNGIPAASNDVDVFIERAPSFEESFGLLTNPCFEDGLNGWSVPSGLVFPATETTAPCDPNVAFFDQPGSQLSQTINVVPGVPIEVSLRWAAVANFFGTGTSKILQVIAFERINGNNRTFINTTFVATATRPNALNWQTYFGSGTPMTDEVELLILDISFNSQADIIVDQVRVEQVDNYSSWASRTIEDSSQRRREADADGDERTNRREYGDLTDGDDPTSFAFSQNLEVVRTNQSTVLPEPHLRFIVPSYQRSDVTVRLRGTTDLTNWNTQLVLNPRQSEWTGTVPFLSIPTEPNRRTILVPLDTFQGRVWLFEIDDL